MLCDASEVGCDCFVEEGEESVVEGDFWFGVGEVGGDEVGVVVGVLGCGDGWLGIGVGGGNSHWVWRVKGSC